MPLANKTPTSDKSKETEQFHDVWYHVTASTTVAHMAESVRTIFSTSISSRTVAFFVVTLLLETLLREHTLQSCMELVALLSLLIGNQLVHAVHKFLHLTIIHSISRNPSLEEAFTGTQPHPCAKKCQQAPRGVTRVAAENCAPRQRVVNDTPPTEMGFRVLDGALSARCSIPITSSANLVLCGDMRSKNIKKCALTPFVSLDVMLRRITYFSCSVFFALSLYETLKCHQCSYTESLQLLLRRTLSVATIAATVTSTDVCGAGQTCLAVGALKLADTGFLPEVNTALVNALGECTTIFLDVKHLLTPSKTSPCTFHTLSKSAEMQSNTFSDISKTKAERLEDVALEMLLTASLLVDNNHSNLVPPFFCGSNDGFAGAVLSQWCEAETNEITAGHRRVADTVTCTSATNPRLRCQFVQGDVEEVLSRSSRLMLTNGQVIPLNSSLKKVIAEKHDTAFCNNNCISQRTAVGFRPVGKKFSVSGNQCDLTFLGIQTTPLVLREDVSNALQLSTAVNVRVIALADNSLADNEVFCRKAGLFLEHVDNSKYFTNFRTTASRKHANREGEYQHNPSHPINDFSEADNARKRTSGEETNSFQSAHIDSHVKLLEALSDRVWCCVVTGNGTPRVANVVNDDFISRVSSDQDRLDMNHSEFAAVMQFLRTSQNACAHAQRITRYLTTNAFAQIFIYACAAIFYGDFSAVISPTHLLLANLFLNAFALPPLLYFDCTSDDRGCPSRYWWAARCLVMGGYIGLATVMGYAWWRIYYNTGDAVGTPDSKPAHSMALCVLILATNVFGAASAVSDKQSVAVVCPMSNTLLLASIAAATLTLFACLYTPLLGTTFLKTSPLLLSEFTEWRVVFTLAMPVLFLEEAQKLVLRKLR